MIMFLTLMLILLAWQKDVVGDGAMVNAQIPRAEDFTRNNHLHSKDSADQNLMDCLVDPSTELLIFVQSRRQNFRNRRAVRSSWGNSSLFPRQQVCVFFVIPSESALVVRQEDRCNQTLPQLEGRRENTPRCPCSSLAALELSARRCHSRARNTTDVMCHSLECTSLLHRMTHCGILSEQLFHSDVLLLPAVERGEHPRLRLQRTLLLLRRRMQVFLGRTTANGADILVCTDSSVVNIPQLLSRAPKLLPLATGRMHRRFAPAAYAAAGEIEQPRVLRPYEYKLMLLSQPCVSELSNKSVIVASRRSAKCQIVSVPVDATVPFCSASQVFVTFSAGSGRTPPHQQVEECWKKMRQESDADHQSRSLIPRFSFWAIGSRRRSIVTVVTITPDPYSLLTTQLLAQLRHQSLQPHVHLILVVPSTPVGGQSFENAPRLRHLLETHNASEWVSVMAVKPGESVGAQRNMAIREAAEWSRYITVWALDDFHSPGLLDRQVQHVQQHLSQVNSEGKHTSSHRQQQDASANAVYLTCSAISVDRAPHVSRGTLLVTDLDVVAPLFTADLSRYCTYPDADVAIDASHITCATLRGFQVLSASCQLDVVHRTQALEYEAAFRQADTLPAAQQRDYMLGLSEAKLFKESSTAGNQFLRHAMVPRVHVHRSDGPNKVLSMPGITDNVLLFPVVRHLAHFQRRPHASVVVAWESGGAGGGDWAPVPVGWRRELVRFFERDSWKGQLQLVFCGSGTMEDLEVRMQLLAEWHCSFCDYAHVPARSGPVPLGTVLQRGVDSARSNYVVVLHVPHILLATGSETRDSSGEITSASQGIKTLASILRAWKFSLEGFLTRVFQASADLVILHGADTPDNHFGENLDWTWVALGFVREAGQMCNFVASDWDCVNLFCQCVRASGLRLHTQRRALFPRVTDSSDERLATHDDAVLVKLESMVRLKLPHCEQKFAFDSHAIDLACKDGALALAARLRLDKSLFLPTIITFAGSEGTNIESLNRNLREFLSGEAQPDVIEVHLHSDPHCNEGNNGVRSSSSSSSSSSSIRNHKHRGVVRARTACVPAPFHPGCGGATSTAQKCPVQHQHQHQELNFASIATSRWMLEWYSSGRNYSDHYISRVVQHFQQDDADVIVCRCWRGHTPNSDSDEQCALSAGQFQIVAFARNVLEHCPYPNVFRVTESNEEPSLVAPHATEDLTASFLLCALKHKFKILERRSCSAYFTVKSVPNNFGSATYKSGRAMPDGPGNLPMPSSSRVRASRPSTSRSVSSWLRRQLELQYWPAADYSDRFEGQQPQAGHGVPSTAATVAGQTSVPWVIEQEPVVRAEDAGAFAAELLQSGFVNFGLSPIEMCAQHHPAALQPWHYDAAFYL